jgi:hypothetical protein
VEPTNSACVVDVDRLERFLVQGPPLLSVGVLLASLVFPSWGFNGRLDTLRVSFFNVGKYYSILPIEPSSKRCAGAQALGEHMD